MKSGLLAKSLILTTTSIFLLGTVYSSDVFADNRESDADIQDAALISHEITKKPDLSDIGYDKFTWGKKWDLTESYTRFTADNEKYKGLFGSLEELLGYDNGILSGVGYAESRYKQEAKSWASAYGVMQITEVGYQSLLSRYETAKTLIEEYVEIDSMEYALLNKPNTINRIMLKSKPLFNDILKKSPETAKLLVGMYNIREDKNSRRALKRIENWKNIKKPTAEELEVIIKHVFVPIYKSVEYSKEKYFENKLPSFKKIKEDAETNIVVGSLIYDFGKRELSILSLPLDENLKTHFIWESPKVHKQKGTSAISPEALNFMAFGPYNAGFGATIFRLQVIHDRLTKKAPIKVKNALKRGTYYRQTRRGIRNIVRWSSLYNYLEAISNQFKLEQRHV